jgi:hypothetical protein
VVLQKEKTLIPELIHKASFASSRRERFITVSLRGPFRALTPICEYADVPASAFSPRRAFHDQKLAAACRVRLTQGYARLDPALSSPNHRLAPLGYRPKRLPCSGLHDECTTLPRSILPSLGTRNAGYDG